MGLPIINLSLVPVFPANVIGDGPVVVDKQGLNYFIRWDISAYSENPSPGVNTGVLSHDPDSDETGLITLNNIATPSIDARLADIPTAVAGVNGTELLTPETGKASILANAKNGNWLQDGLYSTPRTLNIKLKDTPPTPEDYGAIANEPLFDCHDAFQNAINASKAVSLPAARNYFIGGPLSCPRMLQIRGIGSANADTLSQSGAAKLIFSGGSAGKACFYSAPGVTMMSHGGFYGFSIRILDAYDWAFDFTGAVQQQWVDLSVTAANVATGGIRTQKSISSDPSWLNQIERCNIIIPDAGTRRPVDMDWSDSNIRASSLAGGIGSIERGFGNKWSGNNIERSSNIGLTLLKSANDAGSTITNNFFDANAKYGVAVDVSSDPTTVRNVSHVIVGNKFRTVDPNSGVAGTADIAFFNTTGAVYTGGNYSDNAHTVATVPPFSIDWQKWGNAVLGPNSNLNSSIAPFQYENFDRNFYCGPQGINISYGPANIRASVTQFGMSNVAGFFGSPVAGNAGVQIGAAGGSQPYIAASRDITGAATDLRFYTDITERIRLHSGGSWLRPASDNAMSSGTSANRWSVIYAGTGTINTSDEREKQDIGAVPDAWLDAWGDVQWSRFKMREAVAQKGDEARWHVGLIAQQIRDAFAARGLDAQAIGLLCLDEWDDEYEPVMATRLIETGRDGDGNPILQEEMYDTGETRLVRPAGSLWGVRYSEAQAMEAAFVRRALDSR